MRSLRTLMCTVVFLSVVVSTTQAKTNYAYTPSSANTVSVINTSNNTVVKTIPVGTGPWGVAVNQAGTSVYVTNQGSNSVSVISTTTNAVVATIPVGANPLGVAFAPNGKAAYVADGNSNSVSVINTATKKVTATIPVQNYPYGLAVTPNGAFVYVANYRSGTVSVISTLTNKVVATVSVSSGASILAISPDGSTVYVPNNNANTISIIRVADNTVVNTINVDGAFGAAVSPDGHSLYATDSSAGSHDLVTVIDTNTHTVTATITVGQNPDEVAFSEDSSFAYVVTGSGVYVIDTASHTVVNTITGVGSVGIAVMGTVKVSTVAGGYVGDKAKATNAALGAPYSSVLDGAGNLYISDIEMHRIRKVDASGNITTYAGNGICGYNGENVKASSTMICAPNGLALDGLGNLIVADGGNGRIRKIDRSTGTITTIAGNGLFGYNPSEDGGPALNAQINQPFDLAYDAAGNLYFDEVGACVIREVDTSGIIHTVAGTGTCGYNGDNIPAKTAELNLPRGVAIDSNGNLYIGDTVNHRVRKVDNTGTITTFAGTGQGGFSCNGGPATSSKVGSPRGLTVSNNVLYIGNAGRLVCAVDLSTDNISTYAGSNQGYDGDGHSLLASEFFLPTFILFDSSGNPTFDDGFNGRVRKATGGILSTIAGGFIGVDGTIATQAAFGLAEALAVDKSGNLYIADTSGHRVRKVSGGKITTIAGTGINGYTGDGGKGIIATLNEPYGVAVDSSGNVFISDSFNNVIRKVDTSGIITTFATNSNFGYLAQLATDSTNNLYVADNGSCVVWKVTLGGVVSIAAGVLNTCGYNGDGIAATTAQLNGPYSVALDTSGNLFIADNGNNRLREVNTSGLISTIAGNGTCGYTGDGGSATAAELCPNSVAVDNSGTAYVADNFTRIRKIKGGIITTFAGAGFGFNGDGLWPLYTAFDDPVAVAVDSKGTVYELDDYDHRVRQIK